jgi:preprotein translocase subunit SecA
VRIRSEEEIAAMEAAERAQRQSQQMQFQHADVGGLGVDEEAQQAQALAAAMQAQAQGGMPRVGRNDPCPCGSGKKFKHCHGQIA